MQNCLEKNSIINKGTLDGANYFESLLYAACEAQLLNGTQLEQLQYACLELLARKAEQYNAGESSSIPVERAQALMQSSLFTMGLWLKTYRSPEDAVAALQSEPIDVLYAKGCKRIRTVLAAAKTVHAKLMHPLFETPNTFYRATIEEGIGGFFKLYNPEYAAQEIHITADYPVYVPMQRLTGVEFIQAYLNSLYYENQFCLLFAPSDVHHLLCGYTDGYESQLLNLYEPVLLAALGCAITGTDIQRLDITPKGVAYLERLFTGMPAQALPAALEDAANTVIRSFSCPPGLARYIADSLPVVCAGIQTALQTKNLRRAFALPSFPENQPKFLFSYGEKMDDDAYRAILAEIADCRHFTDKAAIIRAHIHSLSDLEDILLDAQMAEDELYAVFQCLSLPELAALWKRYPPHADTLRQQEQLLQRSLLTFIQSQPQESQAMAARLRESIEEA